MTPGFPTRTAHLALGYANWDEYVDDRLGDLRLTVPREHRGAAVQSLSRAQMSLRAIAKVLGVSVATAYRDLAGETTQKEPPRKMKRVRLQCRVGMASTTEKRRKAEAGIVLDLR